jgi:PAS domain S-box-containing protein
VRTGHDFSNYKRASLLRRIERRINIRNLPDLPTYTSFLQQNADEPSALLKDLLISVSNFFRDTKSFQTLEKEVLPAIIKSKKSEGEVRIWVAGCATGEEAYSIAMLCAEQTLGTLDAAKVQIFGTDIDDNAIAVAREGYYTLNDAADVSPDRLRRFFNKEGNGYRVRREIRAMIVFANHNFLKDPPFLHIDLVTCRNVLIYLNAAAQQRVMETFHFSLNPGSFLFLGSSESVDGASHLYAILNREHRIFQAREVSTRNYTVPETVPTSYFPQNKQLQKTEEKETRQQSRILYGELHQKLLEQYAPPSVVVNREYDIVHMSETVGKYFEISGGEPTQNLLKLIRPELRLELRSVLYRAVQSKTAVEARNVKMQINGQAKLIDIHVRPVTQDGDDGKGFILVIFQQNEESGRAEAIMVPSDEPVEKRLEEELIHLKEQLRNSIEQHEFQEEELKASNEELQAMNEELRAAAEELETRKEELQSINEELRTVNQELKVKIEETSGASNNLHNLINSANVGTIFLDRSFCTRMYTPAVLEIFNLLPSDRGRPISDITHRLQYDGFLQDAETVLEKLTVVEREVTTADNRWFMMRLLPYRTSDDRINGVVITFFDITQRKQAEKALQQSEEHLRLLIESAKDYAIFTLDLDRKVLSWSSGAQLIFGYTEAEIVGKSGDIIFVPEDRDNKAPQEEAETANDQSRAENERWHLRKDGSRFWGSGITHPLRDEHAKAIGFVKIMRDLTLTRLVEEAKFFLAAIVETSNDSIITIDFERNITSWNKAAQLLYGYTAKEAIGKNLSMLTLPKDFLEIFNKVDAVEHSKEVVVFDTVRNKKGGETLQLEVVLSPVLNAAGEVIGVSTIARDVSERKRREANLAFLAKINLDFAPSLTMHEVLDHVGEQLTSYLQLSRCCFSLIDEEDDRVEVIYEHCRDEQLPGTKGVQRISDVFTKEGMRHYKAGKVAVRNAATASPVERTTAHMLKQPGFGSVIDVPHLEGGRWPFLLTVARAEVGEWRSDEVELLQELASKIYIRIERAKAEEALRASQQRLQRMVNVEDVGVLTFDYAGTMLTANDAFLKMVGYSRSEFESRTLIWQDFTPAEYVDASQRQMDHLTTTGLGGPYEKEYFRKDGSRTWLMFVAADLGDGTIVEYAVDISSRKQAEEALRKSERRLQLAAGAAKMGTFVYYGNEDRGELDEQMLSLFGLPPNGKLNISEALTHIIHPDDRALFRNNLAQAMDPSSNGKLNVDIRILHPDSSIHWVNLTAQTNFDSERPYASKTYGVAMDITDRKKAEEALGRSEARFRTLADAVPQVIWTNTADGKANYFNQRWYQYTGLTYEQSAGPGWQSIVHPDDAPSSVEKWKKALAAGEVFDTEYRLRRHDGNYCWFIGRNMPLPDETGKITGWFGTATDVENLKKTEEALSQSEARLRITMESATDYAIITMDTEGRVERWSQGATQLFGYAETEMRGHSADVIFTKEDRKADVPQKEMETARNTGRAADERWHRRKDGSRFYASGVMRPIQNNGQLTGYVKVLRDMTQQQLFTEELHRLVAERTIELERSNQDLRQFAHIASHDLKEPVRKIRTFNNRLKDEFGDKLPKKAQLYLDKVESATSRMYAMIDGVLNYSKVNNTPQVLESVDLNTVIKQIQADLEVLIDSKKAVITSSRLPKVTGSNILLYQLFYNLILNSLKFSKTGEPALINVSSTTKEEDNKKFYEISVSDNGIGFDAEYKDLIFNTFVRLNPADEYEGTGLGLALCKKIVERHQGTISASGIENKGATFTILLPMG